MMVVGSAVLALSFVQFFMTKDRPRGLLAFPVLFMGLTLASVWFSKAPNEALFGFPDRSEGGFVWVAYMALFSGAYLVSDPVLCWKWLKSILRGILCFEAVVGLLQLAGHNPMNLVLVKRLIVPMSITSGNVEGFGNAVNVIGTLNNPNFYGQGIALLLIIETAIGIKVKTNTHYIVTGLGIAALIASNAAGAVVAYSVAALIVLLVSEDKEQSRGEQWVMIGYPILTGGLLFMLYHQDSLLLGCIISIGLAGGIFASDYVNRKKRIPKQTVLGFLAVAAAAFILFTGWALTPDAERRQISGIDYKGMVLEIRYPDETISVQWGDPVRMTTKAGSVEASLRNHAKLTYPGLSARSFEIIVEKGRHALLSKTMNHTFTVGKRGFVAPSGQWNSVVQLNGNRFDTPPYFGFVGKEKFGSGRGYIWSRSIPLLWESPWIGVGPDVYPYYFPQEDPVGQTNLGNTKLFYDKPHSWYLQVAIGTGTGSLLLLLSLFLVLVKTACGKLEDYNRFSEVHSIALALLGFIVVFGVSSLVYDSIIAVALIFWPVLGLLGGAVNSTDKDACDSAETG